MALSASIGVYLRLLMPFRENAMSPDVEAPAARTGEVAQRFLRPEVIRTIARLDLKARFIVEGFLMGVHRSPFHGFSVEFSDYRDYVHGDDPAYIDWKLYARTDKYYVKRFQAETNLRCMLLVDTSASMHYSSRGRENLTKFEYATALAASLGYMMIRQQDRVGLMTFDTRVRRHVPPRSKRAHLFRILDQLLKVRPAGRTDLAKALSTAVPFIRRKGLVILFSDLLDEPVPVVNQLRHLRHRGQDVIVFQILDRAEMTLPFEGPTQFVDPETGTVVAAEPSLVRKEYRRRLQSLLETYRREMSAFQIDYLVLDTSTPFQKALLRFLLYRHRRH